MMLLISVKEDMVKYWVCRVFPVRVGEGAYEVIMIGVCNCFVLFFFAKVGVELVDDLKVGVSEEVCFSVSISKWAWFEVFIVLDS